MGMFTDRSIKALTPKEHTYKLFEQGSDPGFCIQVTPAGARTFLLQYTFHGRRRFLRLGSYPETSLADARQRARDARSQIDAGIDPQAEAKRAALEARTRGSFEQLVDGYISRLEAEGAPSAGEVRRSLEKDAYPSIGKNVPACEVGPIQIRDVLVRLIDRGAEAQSNRVRSYLHAAFQWGLLHDNDPKHVKSEVLFALKGNPVAGVPRQEDAESEGDRALTWEEIKTVWNATDKELPAVHRLAVQLLLTTGQRARQVTRAPAAEIDLASRIWTIPPNRAKNERIHLVPLTDLAIEVYRDIRALHENRGEFLFPSRGDPDAKKPRAKSVLSEAVAEYCATVGMDPWTPRDLRRTWKTRAGELGISKEIRDRLQNHALSDVSSKHYDRYDYLPEKREALEKWCCHLELLVRGNSNVISLPIAKAG